MPVKAYAPGQVKASLKKALAQISSEEWDIPHGNWRKKRSVPGNTGKVVCSCHHHVLATYHKAARKKYKWLSTPP